MIELHIRRGQNQQYLRQCGFDAIKLCRQELNLLIDRFQFLALLMNQRTQSGQFGILLRSATVHFNKGRRLTNARR